MKRSRHKPAARKRGSRKQERPGLVRRILRRLLAPTLIILGAAALVVGVYIAYLSVTVSREFEARRWDLPAQIYATPLELYAGRRLSENELVSELRRLGYRDDSKSSSRSALAAGHYRQRGTTLEMTTRAFNYAGSSELSQSVRIEFSGDTLGQIENRNGEAVPLLRLDPLHIGSVFPQSGEDRLILSPDEIPPLLVEMLKAIEDRRFATHHGVDLRAVVRAALVDLRYGEIRQGASTITQQLVRSFFLNNKQTVGRKLREALMAVALELRYSKQEIMQAYVNEVYLGQDGIRAIHGFGLGSQFYFGKPLAELKLDELALLVAQVRGPSYYNPRNHPERALARRNLVLDQLVAQGIIDAAAAKTAEAQDINILPMKGRVASYYASFLDLVRRQLYTDYPPDTLERKGLVVFTTLDPAVQSAAESGLKRELDKLDAGRGKDAAELEGAVVVTNPQSAEVLAIVGSRKGRYDGFNRALDADRPIGSLVKPAVYLAALESGNYTLASMIDDTPISVDLKNGKTWTPGNFSGKAHGPVPLVRALAESFNMATVRLGLDVGVEKVARMLVQLGLQNRPPSFPSLLLGAVALSPYHVAQVYNTLANGGFRAPLRAVRAVVDSSGQLIQRFPLKIAEAANPANVYAVNQALVEVMERGTGRTAKRRIDPNLVVAGKTGTSSDLRDSWFAGFSSNRLIVVWVGNDANRTTGLTGAAGASKVWANVLNGIDAHSYAVPAPPDMDVLWVDMMTGLETDEDCPDAIHMPVPRGKEPAKARRCGSTELAIGSGIRHWFRNAVR